MDEQTYQTIIKITCFVFGHDWIDADSIDPEVEEVKICVRCGLIKREEATSC